MVMKMFGMNGTILKRFKHPLNIKFSNPSFLGEKKTLHIKFKSTKLGISANTHHGK